MGGTLPRFNLQPESETPEDSPLLQVKPLPNTSRRCAFQAVICLAEVLRVSHHIMLGRLDDLCNHPGASINAQSAVYGEMVEPGISRVAVVIVPCIMEALGIYATQQSR